MAVETVAPADRGVRSGPRDARRNWFIVCVCLTVAPIVVVPCLAPTGSHQPAYGLGWVLFLGSSVHVASTGWFYSVRAVRGHMRRHRTRFFVVPAALIVGGVAASSMLPQRDADVVLLGLFGWQFVHFQKQNLGMAALAARSYRVSTPTRAERRALTIAACGAVLGVLGHPRLLQLVGAPHLAFLFAVGVVVFFSALLAGGVLLLRRPAGQRPVAYVVAYGMSLLFFAPVWLFSSPYAAVAGLTIAHGLQYLLMVGLVAGGGAPGRQRTVGVIVLVDIAVVFGLALNRMSHLHGGDLVDRVLFGSYLGVTAAHFVADAGLWRLRDAFPRQFLTQRLPYLLR